VRPPVGSQVIEPDEHQAFNVLGGCHLLLKASALHNLTLEPYFAERV
jgi:hypothetical protein